MASDVPAVSSLMIVNHPEFTEEELTQILSLFCKYASPPDKSGSMDLANLKQLLQALDLAQTHLESKQTFDKYAKNGKLDLDCFMKMVKDLTSKAGTISLESVMRLASKEEIDVDETGVGGAKRFFEAKAKVLEVGDRAYRAFEDRKKEEEEKLKKKEEFKKRRELFQPTAAS
ncbi:EF-hand domain-containing protein D2 homolog isoform X2 [Hyalella azteca]|uniref:EF-hand domain-containing protein D2 homolog isoform X2 n=1 Tax=Hyalella azteca TaxID=294128 RepID=A0A8B7N5I9_HYAAZ|nr:EF-hand domain-containing protein D2 homolog isoform X2 [Hyalella azteca]